MLGGPIDLRSFANKYLPAPVRDALKLTKYNFDIWTFPKRIVAHRYGPYSLKMHIHDRVAEEWYDKDWHMPPEIAFMTHHGLTDGALVFNLGAHQCLIAMLLAKEVLPNGRVIAVEANRHNAQVAQHNIEINRVTNVDVTCAMVSNRVGWDRAAMSFNSSHEESAIAGEMVDAVTIDMMSDRCGLPRIVYMDVEGFEIEALKGAAETLDHQCAWFVELHGNAALGRYGSSNSDVLAFFPADRFTAYLCCEHEREFQPLAGTLPVERCFLVFVPLSAATAPSP